MAIEISEEALYEIFFRTILQVPDCVRDEAWGCLRGEIGHDLIFSFFLPHVILFIFIYILMDKGLPGVASEHGGIKMLFGLGVYIFVIYAGFYGILAAFLVHWLFFTVVIGMIYFFAAKFLPSPSTAAGIGKKVGGYLKKPMDREKKLRKINKDIEEVKKLMRRNPENEKLAQLMAELKMERNKIKKE